MATAFLFPGQGSQAPGMGRDAADDFPEATRVFQEADDTLGLPLSRLCFEGPAEELKRTAITQPAVLTVSVALWQVLHARGLEPDFVAGHSLGEYSALVAAGALSFADALRTVHLRGTWMQEAVEEGKGAMAALLGLDAPTVESICDDVAGKDVLSPANYNGPGQIVVAGHAAAVDRAIEEAGRRGVRKAVRLEVSAPFHCALMAPAQEKLSAHLSGLAFSDPAMPVVTNVDAEPVTTGAAARDALMRQVTAPVRWEASMRRLAALGVDEALEVGPGKVLCGLQRRIDRGIRCRSVAGTAGVRAVSESEASG